MQLSIQRDFKKTSFSLTSEWLLQLFKSTCTIIEKLKNLEVLNTFPECTEESTLLTNVRNLTEPTVRDTNYPSSRRQQAVFNQCHRKQRKDMADLRHTEVGWVAIAVSSEAVL